MRVIGLILILLLAGCASQADIDSWRGANYTDLVMAYGPPSNATELGNGARSVEFQYISDYNGYQCKAWFVLDQYEQVVDGRMRGNIGGCNNLIRERPAALH